MSLRLAHALDHAILQPLAGPLLVIGPAAPADLAGLPRDGLGVQTGDFMDHTAFAAAGYDVAPALQGRFANALVYAARNREAWLAQIAQAAGQVAEGGLVLVDGAKSDGIDSLARTLAGAGLTVESHAKAHGKLLWFARPSELPPAMQDWAEAGELRRNADGFLTAPGMFSHDHADAGSRLLAEHLPAELKGKAADLGAGWGWLSAALLERCAGITTLHLVESDATSLDAATRNITDPRAQFHWGDATAMPALKNLDLVVMNPPFHRRGATNPDLGRAFIRSAARMLAPSGRLYMVANRQLPYEAELAGLFGEVTPLGQTGIYKLITAARPKRRVN